MKYQKTPLTFSQQVQFWEEKGLLIHDHEKAEFYFNHISAYRLGTYAVTFQNVQNVFNPGTTFENILDLYLFDRELRLLVLDTIERIEVAVRSQITHILTHKYGTHALDNPSIFKTEKKNGGTKTDRIYEDLQRVIDDHSSGEAPEVYIRNYKNKYHQPENPPSWMVIELLSFGQLSRLIQGLKDVNDKRPVANHFGLHHTIFESWMHSLNYGRNLCAHHCRFWNRDFVIQPVIPAKTLALPWLENINDNRRCFYLLSIIKYFLQTVNPEGHFKEKFLELISKYPIVPIRYMGIPPALVDLWQKEPLWIN